MNNPLSSVMISISYWSIEEFLSNNLVLAPGLTVDSIPNNYLDTAFAVVQHSASKCCRLSILGVPESAMKISEKASLFQMLLLVRISRSKSVMKTRSCQAHSGVFFSFFACKEQLVVKNVK